MAAFMGVGLGALEKSTDESLSLSEELESEDDGDDFAGAVVDLEGLAVESLSEELVSDAEDSAFGTVRAAVWESSLVGRLSALAGFGSALGTSVPESPSEEEVLDEAVSALKGDAALVADLSGNADAAGAPSSSEFKSELEESLELPFLFFIFAFLVIAGFCDDASLDNFAPVLSFSSSASLSELELDEADFVFETLLFLVLVGGGAASASESLSSLLLSVPPLLLVSFFAASSAAAFAFFADFLVFLAAAVSELSLLSLLLVSSICVLS